MHRILVAVDVEVDDIGTALALTAQMMRKVEWPDEVVNVEIGESADEGVVIDG